MIHNSFICRSTSWHEQVSSNHKSFHLITFLCFLCQPHHVACWAVASTKGNIGSDVDRNEPIKRLPAVEKRQRQENQATRLSGLRITGELCPSHSLVDLANHILESGSIVWIAPSRCTKRDDEVQVAIKEKPTTVQVENNTLKLGSQNPDLKVETNSELKLLWAWQRRGVAMDQCHLLSWREHDAWITHLMHCLSKDQPHGFQSVKQEQLLKADREIWTLLAQEFQGSLRRSRLNDPIPLGQHFRRLATDPRITWFLLPLPASSVKTFKKVDPGNGKQSKPQPPKTASAGTRKRKTRAEKSCPEELKKFNLKFGKGPICWAYNMRDGCRNKSTGDPPRCVKGHHVCRNCHKTNHSAPNCSAKQQEGLTTTFPQLSRDSRGGQQRLWASHKASSNAWIFGR